MHELNKLVKHLIEQIRKRSTSTDDEVLVLRGLANSLGLSNHLRAKHVALIYDKPSLPTKAPEIYRDRKDRTEKIAEFLKRVYKPWIGKGLTRNHLMTLDASAYAAFKNHLAYHGELPDIDLPRKGDQIDRDMDRFIAMGTVDAYRELCKEINELRRIENFWAKQLRKQDEG